MGVRKFCGILLSFCCIIVSASGSSDVFDSVLGNTASCHNTCQMHSLHTYPREETLYACQRGCRLFSICQFVGDSKDLNETKSECESACREAYAQSDEQYACNLGCQSQLPFAEQRMEQSEPQVQFMPEFEFQREETDEPRSIFSPRTSSDQSLLFSSLIENRGMYNPVYKDFPRSSIQERDRDMFFDRSNSEDKYNLFSCLSRNPWLPSWILTTTLILSVFVLIWICCATVSTAVEQYVPAEKLSIYGDMEDKKDQKLMPYVQSSLVIIRSPGGEEQEAGPLPSKVNLNQSNI
ncbi:transmembrane protein 59-like isoform X3 [Myxocyprinus asiaticus]|uniref:transmembrane protein 59-like isoform X3 n=1 Tax=Myxocyprinus asiaticus TaxID=70543 RepID=UPI0022225362|nr:transmembrane protein 59-like isoform X3 [Myxocyprinus asiaticus]